MRPSSVGAKASSSWVLSPVAGSQWKAVAQSSDGNVIVAADHGGDVRKSIDKGVNWALLGSVSPSIDDLAANSDCSVVAVSIVGDGSTPGSAGVGISTGGGSFSLPTLPDFDAGAGLIGGGAVTVSGDGTFIAYADAGFPEMWTSDNTGGSFAKVDTPNDGTGIVTKLAVSRDGATLLAAWTAGIAVEFLDGDS